VSQFSGKISREGASAVINNTKTRMSGLHFCRRQYGFSFN